MATIFNEGDVQASAAGPGARRQQLLLSGRVPGTAILLDRIALDAGGTLTIATLPTSIGWLQGLSGEATLTHGDGQTPLTDAHVCLLPAGFSGELHASVGATLLYGEIPDAQRFDSALAQRSFHVLDWRREPVLDSEHDARKRIYLITPKLFGTKAVKGEMIIYPPGTAAANHHHEDAEHLMYVLRGRGTVYANEELVFSEFFAPAEFRTIWVDENKICTWNPSGRDIEGRAPIREIKSHSSADVVNPADV
jgi:hypothetical protein